MEITEKLKERFCKDYNIPIKVYKEPYFSERLNLFDPMFHCMDKWKLFLTEVEKYDSEQDYFEEYNRIKDTAINTIKQNEDYQRFNNMDMSTLYVKTGLPGNDIYKPQNEGKIFISIDMTKANFSALSHYSSAIFDDADSWEEFIGKFTNSQYIIGSKYIRQVILGNCNPKRHTTYEKYLTGVALDVLEKEIPGIIKKVVFFSNDEIVLEVSDEEKEELYEKIKSVVSDMPIKFHTELFVLRKVKEQDIYYKEIMEHNKISHTFKCADSLLYPFLVRAINKETPKENDYVFYHNGYLAKLLDTPQITL